MPQAAISNAPVRDFERFAIPSSIPISEFSPGRLHRAGSQLFSQGDPAQSVFRIEGGLVKLIRSHADGRGERIVGLRARGWVLGAAAAIANELYVATAVAVVTCKVARLGAAAFLQRLGSDHSLMTHILGMHAHEVCSSLTQLGAESISATTRLRQLLVDLASPIRTGDHPHEYRVEIPLRQWELAQLLGVAAPYLSELLSDLETEGALRREGHGVMIIHSDLDPWHRGPHHSSEY